MKIFKLIQLIFQYNWCNQRLLLIYIQEVLLATRYYINRLQQHTYNCGSLKLLKGIKCIQGVFIYKYCENKLLPVSTGAIHRFILVYQFISNSIISIIYSHTSFYSENTTQIAQFTIEGSKFIQAGYDGRAHPFAFQAPKSIKYSKRHAA